MAFGRFGVVLGQFVTDQCEGGGGGAKAEE